MHAQNSRAEMPRRSSEALRGAIIICLSLIVLALYYPVLQFEFLNYDDNFYVTERPEVLQGITWKSLAWACTYLGSGHYQPLVWGSFMADQNLLGGHAGSMHFENVLLHASTTIVVFLLFNYLLSDIYTSALCALLFAVHPLNVESVAWISERKGLISGLALMTACYHYAKYIEKPTNGRYALVVGAWALSALAKASAIVFPLLTILLSWAFSAGVVKDQVAMSKSNPRKSFQLTEAAMGQKGLIFASLILGAVTLRAQEKAGALVLPLDYSMPRLYEAILCTSRYIVKFFAPCELSFFYRRISATGISVIVGFAVIGSLCALAWFWRRSSPRVAFGLLWYMIGILPVCGAVRFGESQFADRYSYLPVIGLSCLTSAFLSRIVPQWVARTILAVSAVIACSVSVMYLKAWKNSNSLMLHAIAVDKDNYLAHNNYAWSLASLNAATKEDLEKSVRHAQIACDLTGFKDFRLLDTLGFALERSDRQANALQVYSQSRDLAVALTNTFWRIHFQERIHGVGKL